MGRFGEGGGDLFFDEVTIVTIVKDEGIRVVAYPR